MAILNNNPLVGASGNQGGYNINNSLRFRSSASAYLNRTPASTTNRQTWTWSGWVKRGALGARQHIFVSANPVVNTSGQQEFQFAFNSSDQIEITGGVSGVGQDLNLTTTQVFRDPSAWYHFVVAIDTTQATSSNRMKFYVNGVQVTAFGTAIYPAQNHNTAVNLINFSHRIGGSGGSYLDAYQADINFIDGSAKTPSDFGETDTITGVWKPKAYTGTYGTNGFYLKFSDIATTSGSNAGLGKDFSGNTNYWTTNNISVTSGTTYDAMTDSPTLTSATTANYCTWNPLVSPNATYSNGNLRFAGTANNVWISPTMGVSSGKFYWECTVEAISSTILHIGITQLNGAITEAALIARTYYGDGTKYSFQTGTISGTSFGSSYAVNDIIQVALDMDSGKVWFGKNNTWQASGNPSAGTNEAYSGLSGTFGPFAGKDAVGNQPTVVLNCGQRPFSYTPPTGFVALNTYNLPTPTILQGNKYMDATLYTGNGANRSITNAGAFKPDAIWIKTRSAGAYNHHLVDSVRGANKNLRPNLTGAEDTTTDQVTAINSNGFSLGVDTAGPADSEVNVNGNTYVAWQWQAGQGSTSSNTSGSITSTVSVNTTAGFSIVTFTSNNTGGATVGHGLGVKPSMIILKRRGGVSDWDSYHTSLGATKGIGLNTTSAATTSINYWNNTEPTSSVFTLGAGVNPASITMVAYCWAEIAGFSAFGSYTGNGSADGPFVATNFKPKFVMIKVTSTTNVWLLIDATRNPYNVANLNLNANDSAAENTASTGAWLDFTSNGFKIRNGSDSAINSNGATYVYACFAESPFKNSLAR